MKYKGIYSFPNRLSYCLKSMANGNTIKVKSGHTLAMPPDQEDPGILMTRRNADGSESEELVFQIGEDVVWRMLIQHAKEMTKDDAIQMMFSYADIKLPGKYQNE